MEAGFFASLVFSTAAYLLTDFRSACVLLFFSAFANTLGNGIFNATLMLAIPKENRGGILGLISSASMGGSALSTVLFGIACDIFPIPVVFTVGNLLALIPMLYLCRNRRTREFLLHSE